MALIPVNPEARVVNDRFVRFADPRYQDWRRRLCSGESRRPGWSAGSFRRPGGLRAHAYFERRSVVPAAVSRHPLMPLTPSTPLAVPAVVRIAVVALASLALRLISPQVVRGHAEEVLTLLPGRGRLAPVLTFME
jgi:hypothetical protein